ncbi:MAG: hypothetical protein H6834_08925 [Planctomycetes bacterium]|nr:hypothetical protein [Planctomycetota bacterium]
MTLDTGTTAAIRVEAAKNMARASTSPPNFRGIGGSRRLCPDRPDLVPETPLDG